MFLINPYFYAAPSTLLLDLYPGAAAAYSLRKLRSAYNGFCIQVLRTSDLVTQNFGFVNNVLDTTALLTFIGLSNGSIITWYDQSGNGINATKLGASGRNLIVVAGVLQTLNAKPAVYLPNLDITGFSITGDLSYIMVQRKLTSNVPGVNIGTGAGNSLLFSNWVDGNIYFQRSNGVLGLIIGASDTTTGNQILNAFNQSGSMSMYKNNSIYTLNTNTTFTISNSNFNNIGSSSGATCNGYSPEIIVYTNSQLANRTEINGNINNFYQIYWTVSDPDAQAFVDRVYAAGGTLTSTEANAVNTLTIDLKSAGIWTSMKVIYPMVGSSAAACAQNLKSSSFTGTFTSGWTFASTGVTGNGTSAYMNTNFNTNVNLVKTSAHLSVYVRNNSVAGQPYDLANASNTGMTVDSSYLIVRYTSIFTYFGIADPSYATGSNSTSDSKGFWCGARTINAQIIYKNGLSYGIGTAGTTNLANNNLYLGAANGGGTALFFSDKQYAFASIGDGLTDAQASNFYNSVQAFQTSLSRNL